MQTTKRNYTKVARTALVLSVALMVLATMAAPAFADDDPLIVEMVVVAEALQLEPVEDGGLVPADDQPPLGPVLGIGGLGGLLGVEGIFEMEPLDENDLTVIPDGGAFEMVPADQPPIGDGGDWEMVPGDDETDTPEPDVPDNSETPTDTPVPDEPADQQESDEPTDEQDSDEPTETPVPDEPADNDEDSLPFTGGNGTPFGIVGIAIALAGAGYLLRKRYVFARD